MWCHRCDRFLEVPGRLCRESGLCFYCRSGRDLALRLADRIFLAHEIIGKRAEKRAVTTETDYCPLGG